MSRHLAHLAALAAALAATACAPDATAPAPARKPAPSALTVSSLLFLPQDVHTVVQVLEDGRVLVRFPPDVSAIWSPTAGVSPAGPNSDVLVVKKISPSGRYVGSYEDPITGKSRAWTSIGTGGATTLPLPAGFDYASATDVNACGTILGYGYRTSDSQPQTIVWRRSFTCDLPSSSGVTAGTF